MESCRLYIGGISESVLENDIKAKFGEFGNVRNVEIRCKENYGNRRFFAYIDIEADPKAIDTCVRKCNNFEWKGGCLKVQPAKESYLQKTQKEILERKVQPETSDRGASSSGSFGQQKKTPYNDNNKYKPETEVQFPQEGVDKRKPKEEPMEVDDTGRYSKDKKWDSSNRQDVDGQLQSNHKFSRKHDRPYEERGGKRKSWKDDERGYDNTDQWNANRNQQGGRDFRHNEKDWNKKETWEEHQLAGTTSATRMSRDSNVNRQQRDHRSFDWPKGRRGAGTTALNDDFKARPVVDAFESQRNDLFEDIDAADEIGQLDDEVPDLDGDGKYRKRGHTANTENENDPISESNLKELLDGKENQGFTLSSLFADQLKVEQLVSSDDDDNDEDNESGRFSRRMRRDSGSEGRGVEERFGDDYWRRAEGKVHQKSWEEMRRRPNDRVNTGQRLKSGTQASFFILPGDKRLDEGLEVFQTDADPLQFIDAWAEQAEQLSLSLFQRKTNTRVQQQMAHRLAGSEQGSQKKSFRKGRDRDPFQSRSHAELEDQR